MGTLWAHGFCTWLLMTNCPPTMIEIGKNIITSSYESVVQLVQTRAAEKIPTYRGGQLAGALKVSELGDGLIDFMRTGSPLDLP